MRKYGNVNDITKTQILVLTNVKNLSLEFALTPFNRNIFAMSFFIPTFADVFQINIIWYLQQNLSKTISEDLMQIILTENL